MDQQQRKRAVVDWALWLIAGGCVIAGVGFFNAIDDGMALWEAVAILGGLLVAGVGALLQALKRRRLQG